MESIIPENKKKSQKVDRVVLDPKTTTAIQTFIDQAKAELGDLVDITQKDMVNFLIQERAVSLSELEISKIKNEHFDIVKALKQATQEAIKAKKAGNEVKMDEVLKLIQNSESKVKSLTPKVRRKKQSKEATAEVQETIVKPV